VDLKSVYIRPEHRGSGCGPALVSAISAEVGSAHDRLARYLNHRADGRSIRIAVAAECLSEGGAALASRLVEDCTRAVSGPRALRAGGKRTAVIDAVDYGDHVAELPAARAMG
jgi:GNAT superfamily N-acetyltransferase